MGSHVLQSLAVGAMAAVITYVIDPSPSWWLVGGVVAAVLIVNPCRSRR